MDISRVANLIHFATFIIQVCLYQSSIINSKTLSIIIVVQFSIGFNDIVVRLYTDYESLCAGTYSITIYCGYSLDFIIGYFKVFSNAIFNFDSYGISIDFSDDNSKTFDDGGFNSFEDGVISYDFNIIVIGGLIILFLRF